MFKDIMLNARFNNYVNEYELNGENDEENKKKYICYTYLSQIHPEKLDRDLDLLEIICNDKFEDDKIVGVAIALNEQLLTSYTDIDDILQIDGKGKFDIYIFAYEGAIAPEKIILDIIKGENKKFEFAKIIQHMYSQKIIVNWDEVPNVNIIYIAEEAREVIRKKEAFFIKNTYQLDEDKILRIARSNEKEYEGVLQYTDGFPFPKEKDEGQTYVVLCEADKLIDVLKNEDGLIRANIFDANVRAYQGDTDVNNEILLTLKDCPGNFVLYNNGITIVCNQLKPDGKALNIRNPQVVNGCQTCNSIFKAYKQGIDLSKVKVIVKVIETKRGTIAQGIVRGTNRQNIVYEEAFETIRQFHKDLEEFFNMLETKGFHKAYYERRSKQYNSDTQIKPYQKITFRTLIQSTVAMYMNKVEISHRHESKLIADYKNILFVEGQSFYPYYIAGLLSSNLDYVMKKEKGLKDLKSYKMHILFMIQELNMGASPDINDKEKIEEYCKKFLNILSSNNFIQLVMKAADKFRYLMQKWIEKKGDNYRFYIKDNPEFTEFMFGELRGNTKINKAGSVYSGTVMTVKTDKYGTLYGFISNQAKNIYFNELDNPELNISYEGKKVTYKVSGNGREERAINVKLV